MNQPPSYVAEITRLQSVAQADPSAEVTLWKNLSERKLCENLADLYSIIVTTEHLEAAYIRDSISADEYTAACNKLIAQYKTMKDAVSSDVPDILGFIKEFKINAPAATHRLVTAGVPATVEHGGSLSAADKNKELYVAQSVQYFITALDSLKLEMVAVDELHPHLNDLLESLNKISTLSSDNPSKTKVMVNSSLEWLRKLHTMKASDELSKDEARQLSFDLEQSYDHFHKFLQERYINS